MIRDPSEQSVHSRQEAPVFAAPGTMEEETIDDEEADTIHYEASSDEGYDEFEEETQAGPGHLNGDARETVAEIHQASMTDLAKRIPPKALLPKAKKTAKNWNSKRRRPKPKPCSTPKPAAMAPSMPASKFALRRQLQATRSAHQRPRPGHDRDRGPRDRQRRGGGGDRGGGRGVSVAAKTLPCP